MKSEVKECKMALCVLESWRIQLKGKDLKLTADSSVSKESASQVWKVHTGSPIKLEMNIQKQWQGWSSSKEAKARFPLFPFYSVQATWLLMGDIHIQGETSLLSLQPTIQPSTDSLGTVIH